MNYVIYIFMILSINIIRSATLSSTLLLSSSSSSILSMKWLESKVDIQIPGASKDLSYKLYSQLDQHPTWYY